jgi:hypothetical protein
MGTLTIAGDATPHVLLALEAVIIPLHRIGQDR